MKNRAQTGRPKRRYSFSLFLLVLSTLFLAGCQTSQSLPFVSLKPSDYSRVNPQPLAENKDVLRVGVSSVLSPRETLDNYKVFADYLQQKLGRPVQLVQRQTYKEINDLVRDNGVDVAFICSGAYIMGDANLELLAVPEVNGKATYQSYIIVNVNSKARNFADLKGQVFAFTDPISFSGTIAPSFMVRQLNTTPQDFFGRIVYTYSHDNSINAVLDNVVAGAGLDSLVYQFAVAKDPSLAGKLRIIARSPEVGSPPVVVNRNIDPHMKAALLEALLQMDHDALGKQALKSLTYDRFVLPNEADYNPIRAMVAAIPLKL